MGASTQMRRVLATMTGLAAVALVVTTVAACGSSSSSQGSTSNSTSTSTGGAKPGGDGSAGGKSSSVQPVGRGQFKGLDFCKILTDQSLTAIGLQPSEGHPPSNLMPDADPDCEWESNGTKLEVNVVADFEVDMSEGETKITVLGYPGIADTQVGNSCQVTMQVGKDEFEATVENDDPDIDNPALVNKACDVAKGFTTQVLSKISK